ncbi:hypothetical protein TVAG_275520 [Trichomonas vaginalis G3]|uniref:Prominin n=1 Tax=Trichomonas vaginalis (strain ATCC PRA-98 / G3) TaxID=412133 RepID=A2FAQ6_TRIV3|nr:tweety family [Trichomonas vaginalis G3]EAX98042.1 hypothetical protein TVAG_275520 [Trichomonas vaginalis G3]KAI5528571.1 tweety family [Trichomonas vaginalis G3]|eukprot:XP_001310972.1 hypothetical protein [Trichomonas vaginalis G3]
MIFVFFLIWKLKAEDLPKDCKSDSASGLGKFVYKAYQGIAPSANKVFKLNQMITRKEPIYEFDPDKHMEYLASLTGFIAVILIILVIVILFFLISQCGACCCFKPTKGKKFTWSGAIVHLVFIAVMVVSLVLFYFASGSIVSGVNNAAVLNKNIHSFVEGAFDAVLSTVGAAINLINDLVKKAEETFRKFIHTVNSTLNDVQSNVTQAVTKSEEAKNYSEGELKTAADEVNNEFKSCCNGCDKKLINNDSIVSKLSDIYSKMKEFQNNIQKINETQEKIQKSIDEINNSVKGKIEDFSGKINESINKVDYKQIYKYTDEGDAYIQKAKKLIGPVVIIAVVIISIIIAVYAIIFFFNKGCCRCLACSFPAFGFLFALLLGLPCLVFAILVPTFYSACPKAETLITKYASSVIPSDTDINSVLYCNGTDKSLYRLLKFGEKFKINEKLDEFKKKLEGTLTAVNATETLKALNDVVNINQSSLNLEGLTEAIGKKDELKKMTEKCSNKTTEINGKIDEYFNKLNSSLKHKLDEMTKYVLNSINRSSQISPQMANATNTTQNLLNEFFVEFNVVVVDGLSEKLQCDKVCSIYVPVRNALCVNLVNGGSFWLISCLIMVIGCIAVMFTVCCRRKTMRNLDASSDSSSFFVYSEDSYKYSD